MVLFFAFFEVALIPMWFVINGWGDRHDEPRPASRGHPVPGLHRARVGADAGRLRARPLAGRHLRHRADRRDLPAVRRRRGHRGRARRARPGGEDAAVAAAHLAARRALQGADGRVGRPRRRCCSSSAPTGSSGSGCRWPTRPGGCWPRSSPGLAVVGIVYAALACLAQTDLKRLIAYSSVGHMGFVVLAVATFTLGGVQAAVFASVAHGLVTGLLFFLAGAIKDRYGTGDLRRLTVLYGAVPRLAALFAVRGDGLARPARTGRLLGRDAGDQVRGLPRVRAARSDVHGAGGDRGARGDPDLGVLPPAHARHAPGHPGGRPAGQRGRRVDRARDHRGRPGHRDGRRRAGRRGRDGVADLVAAGRPDPGARRRAGPAARPGRRRRARRSSGASDDADAAHRLGGAWRRRSCSRSRPWSCSSWTPSRDRRAADGPRWCRPR